MKKPLFLYFVMALLMSCSKEEPTNCCTTIDLGIYIEYLDENGNNLLTMEDGISIKNIRTQEKEGDEWKTRRTPSIVETDEGSFLKIFANSGAPEELITYTRVKFSPTEADTIKTELTKKYSNILISKVWYNDLLKWDVANADGFRKIVIRKK